MKIIIVSNMIDLYRFHTQAKSFFVALCSFYYEMLSYIIFNVF